MTDPTTDERTGVPRRAQSPRVIWTGEGEHPYRIVLNDPGATRVGTFSSTLTLEVNIEDAMGQTSWQRVGRQTCTGVPYAGHDLFNLLAEARYHGEDDSQAILRDIVVTLIVNGIEHDVDRPNT